MTKEEMLEKMTNANDNGLTATMTMFGIVTFSDGIGESFEGLIIEIDDDVIQFAYIYCGERHVCLTD